ncbi:MAG: hypothetical protein Q8P27_00895 [Candidatus Peregrinibacteria bacterium]|nr:hypothetical protein [Candidatus Peregrinibacteria bacterium]
MSIRKAFALSFMAMALLLFGVGCEEAPSDEPLDDEEIEGDADLDLLPEDDYELTSHGSVVIDGVDDALEGSWQFESLTIQGVTMNFTGHTLSYDYFGNYSQNFSSQEYTGPEHSLSDCENTGSAYGNMFSSTDIYGYDEDGEEIIMNYLTINRGSSDAKVTCEGPEGYTVEVNDSGMELGTGPSAIGGGVIYTYTMSEDWNTLQITLQEMEATYTYVRIN